MRNITFLIVIAALAFITPFPTFAQESTQSARPLMPEHSDGERARVSDIGYSRIDPASPFYFLKTIREDLEMKLAQTQRVKKLRHLEFATRRLREARTLIGKNEDLIPPTLERYIAHLKNLTDTHLKNEQQFADSLKNNLSIHLKTFEQIYNSSSNLRTRLFIRSAMHRIIQRADVSPSDKLIVCNFFEKESSSSALNQTEQEVLKQRAGKCFDNLGSAPVQ